MTASHTEHGNAKEGTKRRWFGHRSSKGNFGCLRKFIIIEVARNSQPDMGCHGRRERKNLGFHIALKPYRVGVKHSQCRWTGKRSVIIGQQCEAVHILDVAHCDIPKDEAP